MSIAFEDLADPTVRAFVAAVNSHNREAFAAVLAPHATMSDDGTDRDLAEWTDKEVFRSNGRMDVVSQSPDGRDLVVEYTNDTWGAMRTRWRFIVEDDRVSRFETGQA